MKLFTIPVKLALVILAGILITSCVFGVPNKASESVNTDRINNGIPTLIVSAQLNTKAQSWADNLARVGTLSHSNLSDGVTAHWCFLGENVGYGGSVAQVEAAYMASPAHRDNILNTKPQFVGTGIAWAGPIVYTVQEFMEIC